MVVDFSLIEKYLVAIFQYILTKKTIANLCFFFFFNVLGLFLDIFWSNFYLHSFIHSFMLLLLLLLLIIKISLFFSPSFFWIISQALCISFSSKIIMSKCIFFFPPSISPPLTKNIRLFIIGFGAFKSMAPK